MACESYIYYVIAKNVFTGGKNEKILICIPVPCNGVCIYASHSMGRR